RGRVVRPRGGGGPSPADIVQAWQPPRHTAANPFVDPCHGTPRSKLRIEDALAHSAPDEKTWTQVDRDSLVRPGVEIGRGREQVVAFLVGARGQRPARIHVEQKTSDSLVTMAIEKRRE